MLGIQITSVEGAVDSESNDPRILTSMTLPGSVTWADAHRPVSDAIRRTVPCSREVQIDQLPRLLTEA